MGTSPRQDQKLSENNVTVKRKRSESSLSLGGQTSNHHQHKKLKPTEVNASLSRNVITIEDTKSVPGSDTLRKFKDQSPLLVTGVDEAGDVQVTPRSSTSPNATPTPKLQYPLGVVKRTRSEYHPSENDVSIASVINSSNLKIGVFSSFQWDLDWFFDKLKMPSTRLILVMSEKSLTQQELYRTQAAEQGLVNLRICFPELLTKGHSIMHSKLMLLFYENHLRIVIPTGNLVPYDWGEQAFLENTVFIIDLPRWSDKREEEDTTEFGQSLRDFCELMDLDKKLRTGLKRFDFSATAKLGLVFSAAGEHECNDDATQSSVNVGFRSLWRSIAQMQLDRPVSSIDYVTSSLGILDATFMGNILQAACSDGSKDSLDAFHVYFPSHRTVKDSMGGADSAGTISLPVWAYKNPNFARKVLRDLHTRRRGLLSHSKIMFVRGKGKAKLGKVQWSSWAYVGSANCTAAAWGKTISRKGNKSPATFMHCSNWECGVVIPGRVISTSEDAEMPTCEAFFDGIVDVPFLNEDTSYADKTPWIMNSFS